VARDAPRWRGLGHSPVGSWRSHLAKRSLARAAIIRAAAAGLKLLWEVAFQKYCRSLHGLATIAEDLGKQSPVVWHARPDTELNIKLSVCSCRGKTQ